jgi:lactoylglutathione lyase
MKTQIILYVKDQQKSRLFYEQLLEREPSLNVDGMTEFRLDDCTLGLMPETGIARILGTAVPHPGLGSGIPRCELYLRVEDVHRWFEKAIRAGARMVSPVEERNWGDLAGYVADPDGHILAFAETM